MFQQRCRTPQDASLWCGTTDNLVCRYYHFYTCGFGFKLMDTKDEPDLQLTMIGWEAASKLRMFSYTISYDVVVGH